MGWSVYIQIVRDRPLDAKEHERLAAHARRFKLSRKSEDYVFRVAPADARGGVVAHAMGKFGRDPDPDEDADAARLYAALTELRTLFADASIEVSDDLALVGWDGEQYGVVDDPDQEMTEAPRDLMEWQVVPAPRVRTPTVKRTKTSAAVEAALAAMTEGRPFAGDLRALASLAFASLVRAAKAEDHELRARLTALIAALPARVVVDAGLEVQWVTGVAGSSIAAALERLESLDEFRQRLLALWFGGMPGKETGLLWNLMGGSIMEAAMRDREVVAAVGDALAHASLEDRRDRLHVENMALLAKAEHGLPYLIARRRADRALAEPPRWHAPLMNRIAMTDRREMLPTLALELAWPRADRDDLLVALGRIQDPRALPLLERALATDQYTRAVTRALLLMPGARADELLDALTAHIDPFVRICAAQGLVSRRGAEAVPRLADAIGQAQVAGIWRDRAPGAWGNTFRDPEAARDRIYELWRAPWPDEARAMALSDVAVGDLASAPARMVSTNPDVRRDAIELAHADALRARDPSRIRALVAAERRHAALCAQADLRMTTVFGTCSRVSVTNYWSSWRKLARIPFDPMYRHVEVTWNWLDARAEELAPQVIPDELAALPSSVPELRLRFSPDELAAWDDAERTLAGSV